MKELSKKRINGAELLPLIAFSWAALVARRNFGPFAIIAAPIFSKYLTDLINEWLEIAQDRFGWVKCILDRTTQSNENLNPGFKNFVNLLLVCLLVSGVVWHCLYRNQGIGIGVILLQISTYFTTNHLTRIV